MKILVLSYFDSRIGPVILFKTPESFESENLRYITNFLDLEEEGFFIHEFNEEFKCANLKFEIPSQRARGNIESLLISIITIDEEPNPKVLKEILKHFATDLQKISNVYEVFNTGLSEDNKKVKEVKSFFNGFYKSLPKETVFTRQRQANIFVFGLDYAGKTTIINRLKKNIFTDPIPTTNINIVRLLFENLSLTAYDTAGQQQYRKIWAAHLKNQDALVFTLDISDDKRFKEAKEELNRMVNLPELKRLPLLIIFNKIDLKQPKIKKLLKYFEIKKIKNRNVKYFLTSAKTNKGITEAFNWIAIEILNNIFF